MSGSVIALLSEKAIVEVLALASQNLLVDGFFVADLGLGLAELDVCRHQVRVLRLIELVSEFKLFFKDGQFGSPLLQRGDVLPRDLRLDARRHE